MLLKTADNEYSRQELNLALQPQLVGHQKSLMSTDSPPPALCPSTSHWLLRYSAVYLVMMASEAEVKTA